jgi:hypothetical protein
MMSTNNVIPLLIFDKIAKARAALNGLSKKYSSCVDVYGLQTKPFFESKSIPSYPNNPINDEPKVSSAYSQGG